MMKKTIFVLVLFLVSASFFMPSVHANELVTLNNYHYVHSNVKGSKQFLKNKSGSEVIHGDANEFDAVIKQVTFVKNGLQSGESLYIVYSDGSTQAVTGNTVNLSKSAESIRIAIDKTTTKETYVKVSTLTTYDKSNGGINVDYLYTMDTPKQYGALGDGDSGSGGGTDPGGGSDTSLPLQWNNGTRRITWSKYPADCYEIIVTDPGGTKYNIVPSTKVFKVDDRGGTYTFQCKRLDGSVIVTKTIDVPEATTNPDPDPGGGTDPTDPGGGTDPGTDPGGGECTKDGCDWLNDIIFCPGWDVVMADLTLAIKDALPPPPDWWSIADMIGTATVRHLSNYLGDVPEPPSEMEIDWATETPLPHLDTSVETNDLVPKVPEEFNKGKIVFELNNGPKIDIKDESKPFRIDDPLKNIDSDPVGQAVFPGDPRNTSNGIKEPDKVDTGNNTPKPAHPSTEPNGPIPKPESNPSDGPSPSNPGGGAAVPEITEGIIPIPKSMGR